MAEEVGEGLPQLVFMLRTEDGSPVNVEYKAEGWEMDPKTGMRKEGRSESFNPRFKEFLRRGTLIEINGPKGSLHYEASTPMRGQEIPSSIYCRLIPPEEFEEKKLKGTTVVEPDNLPKVFA